MFSSNQMFSISGDIKDIVTLKEAFNLLLNGFSINFSAHKITEDGTLELYTCYKLADDMIPIFKEDNNVDYLTNIVALYLSSSAYRRGIKNTPCTYSGDGSVEHGWIIEVDNNELFDKIIIKPFWNFYAK